MTNNVLRSAGLTNFFKNILCAYYTIIEYDGKLYGISQHSMTFTEFRRKYWPSVTCRHGHMHPVVNIYTICVNQNQQNVLEVYYSNA